MLKQRLDQDLKEALLAGDKTRATVIRGLKSVILYAEVAKGNRRDEGLPDDEIIALFAKEAKKRQESAELYTQGGSPEKAEAELAEKALIEAYLPQQLSDGEVDELVAAVITETGASSLQDMGKVIAAVKSKAGPSADGARIATKVKERLGGA
ncbi:MAG TPA: GatB/YqeY domain-containing protein [Candidatus Saccharimonadales bacterium]|nr:GatB/YqeY domain-containing protein [Candidatus Saccharimonadales bacterium]